MSLPTLAFTDDQEYDPATNTTIVNVAKAAVNGFPEDPTGCISKNTLPMEADLNATPRYALQIIPSLGAWNKPDYDSNLSIQLQYAKAMFNRMSALGISGTGLRVFNVDNSVLGAGIHTRIWFKSNIDCINFRDNSDTDGELASFLSPDIFGTPKLRMITMNKCHKWKIPTTFLAQSDFATLSLQSVSAPASPNVATTQTLCTDWTSEEDPANSGQPSKALQLIVSFSNFTRMSYINSATIHAIFKSNLEAYLKSLSPPVSGRPILEIKAIDNSAAGAGVHARIYFSVSNDDCSRFAANLRNYPSEKDQDDIEMSKIWTDSAFGIVTRRSAMRACRNWKSPKDVGGYPSTTSPYKGTTFKAVTGFLEPDMLKPIAEQVAPAIQALFNAVVRQKRMPSTMSTGVITMALKPKATTTALHDHRTITVGTVMDKLYSLCLTRRLSNWGERNHIRATTQTGFRKDHRTTDNVFVLRALQERYKYNSQPLYCAFIDFTKAYDILPRELLWAKLQQRGVSGWMLDALKAQYTDVSLSVKTPSGLTSPFSCTVGLKQGQPSSPDLFGFYVDDIPAAVQALGPNAASPTLDGTTVDPFLHADDIALVSTTEEGLQRQLDALHDYATTWGLQISLVKTNIMRLSGGLPEDDLSTRPTFTINGQPLKWVREFIYLGVTFHETTNMDLLMAETRLLKGRTAQALTRYQCSRLGLTNPGVQVSLLNALVRSTLEYGIEVWGPDYLNKAAALTGNDPAEVLHRHFLRRLLGVRPNTPNLIIYSEFGRYPLKYHWNKRIYAYYQRLTKLTAEGHRFILAAALRDNMQLATTQQAAGIGYSQQAWVGKVSECLGKFGITINLSATAAAIPTIHPSEVETAGQQQHLQQLTAATGSKLAFYKQHILGWDNTGAISQNDYSIQQHLKTSMPWTRRRDLSRFRASSHFLRVEMDRYHFNHVPRNTRTCRLCNNEAVEDEQHMVFECTHTALVQIRQNYQHLFQAGDLTVTTLPALLKQPQSQLAGFITACFTAGDYKERNQVSTQIIRTARRTARATAAAAMPRRHSPRLLAQH
ncbi:hypothetical protein KSW81_006200 [Nannochloris sp. 'desiccata']|nr:hypothetical protein KSW81_006200 [Chlorella desiccata (nom. nud.)]